jgi:hypothetical protein
MYGCPRWPVIAVASLWGCIGGPVGTDGSKPDDEPISTSPTTATDGASVGDDDDDDVVSGDDDDDTVGDVDEDEDGFAARVDCDDTDPDVHPGADEVWYDGVDQDCDGNDDDADGDSFAGDTGPDCDDTDPTVHPGASEVCDGADDDCDGEPDDGVTTTWWVDDDDDGFGGGTAVEACTAPEGATALGGDCDDTDPDVHPAAAEVCDEVDQDCDDLVDEGVQGLFYLDADLDGFGTPSYIVSACAPPAGYVSNAEDCDDDEPLAWTGAAEGCDGVDNDCDAELDEGCPCVVVELWDDDNNQGCPTVQAPGSPPTEVHDAAATCVQLAALHNDAAQLTLYPTAACQPGDQVTLYGADGCTDASVTFDVDCSLSVEHFDLHCFGFDDRANAFQASCASL